MRFQVKKVTAEEFVEIEAQFRNSLVDPGALQEAWESLHDFFATNPAADVEFQWNYFRIYTELTWSLLSVIDRNVVIEIAFGRQIVEALRQDVDVWQKLMWYLSLSTQDKGDTEAVYSAVKDSFLGSKAWVNVVGGKTILLDSIIEDVKKINRPGINSLESAEIMGKIKDWLVIRDIPETQTRMIADSDVVYDRLVGLINFFLGVTTDAIYQVVDSFVDPGKYQPRTSTGVVQSEGDSNDSTGNSSVEVSTETQSTDSTTPVNYTEIKTMIEARFARDASGEFVNLDGVLALLDSLATDQGDDQIRELYYFDEGAGKFQWNQGLLTWYGRRTNHCHQKSGRYHRARSFVWIQENAHNGGTGCRA